MELLFYVMCGILYCVVILLIIFTFILFNYFCVKLLFRVFDTLGVENPFIMIFNYLSKFIGG